MIIKIIVCKIKQHIKFKNILKPFVKVKDKNI